MPERTFGVHRMGYRNEHDLDPLSVGWLRIAALAALISSAAYAGTSADQNKDAPPQVVADASASNDHTRQAALPANAFPAHERGVRQAAAAGNEALRRYIWRTRMIYDFYYNDFAPKE